MRTKFCDERARNMLGCGETCFRGSSWSATSFRAKIRAGGGKDSSRKGRDERECEGTAGSWLVYIQACDGLKMSHAQILLT